MERRTGANNSSQVTLTAQLEDYLETIAELQEADHVARAKDIADKLEITRGTVTSALRSLREKGLINYQPYSHITLTEAGHKLADRIIHRHRVVSRYLHEVLKLPVEVAEENACRAEHVLDRRVIDRLICHMQFLEKCPRMDTVWEESFENFCSGDDEPDPDTCRDCVGRCMAKLYQQTKS
jgi:DtxR family Mn-dependent transcriptional regulator